MNTIFLDFETYYDAVYSLRKMTPIEYILDPRFEVTGCAIKEGQNGKSYWLDGLDLLNFFEGLDPKVTSMVTHNALFDMCIVAWRYNFIPKLMVDTLGIARATLGHKLRSVALGSVADHLGLQAKGVGTLPKVIGMDLASIKAAGFYDEYVNYALGDVDICAGIYDKLVRGGIFPMSELAVMDMVLRCAIEPQFILDQTVLAEHLAQVKVNKDHMLAQAMLLGVANKTDLMSNAKFAEHLKTFGVEPPTKISVTTGMPTFAFAKTDLEFIALEDHPDPAVQTLVAARMGFKSTLEETRCARMLNISQLTWPSGIVTSKLPMPLRYSGAHTHRLSGDWKLNVQNLPRGGKLRSALTAPPGYKVITVDASQIEARLTAWICQQHDMVKQFADGEDVYSNFAGKVFSRPVNKRDNPTERFVGKQGVLGLGFGLGWSTFQGRLKTDSKNQTGKMISLSDKEAQGVVSMYRNTYFNIPKIWRVLNVTGIGALVSGDGFRLGPCEFEHNAILLPSGLKLHYEDLHQEDGDWWFTYGGRQKKLYGGKLLENIIQALDRVIVMDAAVRLQKRLQGYGQLAQQAHDENVYIVKDEYVPLVEQVLLEEMTRRPVWAPDLPLEAEVGVGQNYGEAK